MILYIFFNLSVEYEGSFLVLRANLPTYGVSNAKQIVIF